MTLKLLTEHHLDIISLKGGCTGSCESTLVKMTHCWKSHVTAHLFVLMFNISLNNLHQWNQFTKGLQFFESIFMLIDREYYMSVF